MAVLTRAQIAQQTKKTIANVFGMNYKERPTEYGQVFTKETMDRAVYEEVLMAGVGYANIVGEGQNVSYASMQEGQKPIYRAIKIGLGMAITKEAVRDNLWIKLAPRAGFELERSLRQTKELLHANVFNFSTDAAHLGGDGVTLLNTAHPTVSGQAQANTLAIPSQVSESAIEDMLKMIRRAKNDAGTPIGLQPVKLLAHTDEEFNLLRILASTNRVGTTDNDINALRKKSVFSTDPVLLTWLTNSQHWGIVTDCPDGLKTMQRDPVELRTSMDFETGATKTIAEERYAVGWSDWRAYFGCNP